MSDDGGPVGFPLLSSGPLVSLGVAFMKLPGGGSYGGFLLAGAASCAFALAGGYGLMRRVGTGRAIAPETPQGPEAAGPVRVPPAEEVERRPGPGRWRSSASSAPECWRITTRSLPRNHSVRRFCRSREGGRATGATLKREVEAPGRPCVRRLWREAARQLDTASHRASFRADRRALAL